MNFDHIKNKNIKKLLEENHGKNDFVLHRLSSFMKSCSYKKKKNTIEIIIELPANEVSSLGGDVREIMNFSARKESNLPLIPMLIVFGNKKRASS